MLKTTYAVLAIAFITLLSCTLDSPSEKEAQSIIDIEAELKGIEQLRSSFELAIKEGRYNDLRNFVTPDLKAISAGGPKWDEMRALGEERGQFPYDSIKMLPTETFLLNDTMAYDFGTSKVYYTDEKGEVVVLEDSFLVLLKKRSGQWKLFREVASSKIEY